MKQDKVLMVEDHALVRESLVLMLEQRLPGLHVSPVGSLAQALAALAYDHAFDLVLLDLDLSDSKGLATLDRVREAAPGVPVFVLTGHDGVEQQQLLCSHGAAGYICKIADAEHLIQALLAAFGTRLQVPTADPGEASEGFLSERQRDVLRLLAEGLPNKEISRALQLSEATVKTHLQALFMRLQVNSRTQAVVAASKLGLLSAL